MTWLRRWLGRPHHRTTRTAYDTAVRLIAWPLLAAAVALTVVGFSDPDAAAELVRAVVGR